MELVVRVSITRGLIEASSGEGHGRKLCIN
jgi:hypothetical protein